MTSANPNVRSLFSPTQLSTSLMEVTSTSPIKIQTLPSSSKLTTLVLTTSVLSTSVLSTSILDLSNISIYIPSISPVSIFTASLSMSTIISILGTKEISVRIVEPKVQPSTKILGKGKEMEEEINLDEEIVIPNWEISKITRD